MQSLGRIPSPQYPVPTPLFHALPSIKGAEIKEVHPTGEGLLWLWSTYSLTHCFTNKLSLWTLCWLAFEFFPARSQEPTMGHGPSLPEPQNTCISCGPDNPRPNLMPGLSMQRLGLLIMNSAPAGEVGPSREEQGLVLCHLSADIFMSDSNLKNVCDQLCLNVFMNRLYCLNTVIVQKK